MVYKKIIGLVFFFILLSLLPASFAGRQAMLANNHLEKQDMMSATYEEEVNVIHERVLRANTKDYGKYDPSPTFVKPPFKLIPN